MLSALLGGYLTAYPPPPLPPATAAGPSPSARLPAPFPARPRHASLLVAGRRAAGAGEVLSASAAAEGDDEYEYEAALQEEGFPSWTGGGEEDDDYDHDPEIGDIMGDYFDDPKKAQTRVGSPVLSSSFRRMNGHARLILGCTTLWCLLHALCSRADGG